MGQQRFFVKSPTTDRPHRRGPRHRSQETNTKKGHGTKAYSSAKGRFFPLHALPGDAFPAVVTESSERHERDQKRAEKAWLVALSAPRQSCCMAPAGIGRLLISCNQRRASLARWGIGPDRARSVTAGLETAAGVCLLVYAEGNLCPERWVAWLGCFSRDVAILNDVVTGVW